MNTAHGALPLMLAALAVSAAAQVKTEVPAVVPGAKPVIIFLPPSYSAHKSRRYPVVYALHGYSIGAEQWTKEIHVPQTIEGAFAQGA